MPRIFSESMISNMKWWYKGITVSELTDKVNKEYKTNLSVQQVKAACARYKLVSGNTGHFKKGGTPHNKGKYTRYCKRTEFKKGHKPVNTKNIGAMRYCEKDDMWLVKVPGGKWQSYQRALYELEIGKLNRNEIVIVIDKSQPITLDNIAKVTRRQSVKLNKMQFSSQHPDVRRTLIAIVKLETTASDKNEKTQ